MEEKLKQYALESVIALCQATENKEKAGQLHRDITKIVRQLSFSRIKIIANDFFNDKPKEPICGTDQMYEPYRDALVVFNERMLIADNLCSEAKSRYEKLTRTNTHINEPIDAPVVSDEWTLDKIKLYASTIVQDWSNTTNTFINYHTDLSEKPLDNNEKAGLNLLKQNITNYLLAVYIIYLDEFVKCIDLENRIRIREEKIRSTNSQLAKLRLKSEPYNSNYSYKQQRGRNAHYQPGRRH